MLAVDEGIARIEDNGQAINLSELLRIKGTLLMSATKADLAAAEELFLTSLNLASRQHALAFELRAATSLARLRLKQGRPNSAIDELSPVYARFTEGFGSRDLREARALLVKLGIVENEPH
jgi:predicted ATPase